MTTRPAIVLALMTLCLSGFAVAQESDPPLVNWAAPPYWNPAIQPKEESEPVVGMVAHAQGMQAQAEALPSSPLPFVAIAPCRIVDTRQPIADGFHQPNFANDESRTFNLPASPDCTGLPATSGAWSINIQFRPMAQLSYLTAYPTGTSMPPVSTMTAGPAAWVQNAAIVPAGTGGAIDIYCQYAGRVVIDINGYYGPQSVVTSLNTKIGDVTLAQGSNVTITPSGNTLTIAATAGPGGALPTGTSSQTLYHNGSAWTASSALTNDGTDVGISGTLNLPVTTATGGQIVVGGNRFLHSYGTFNTFLGAPSGNVTLTGVRNTAIGAQTFLNNTSGQDDTAAGVWALVANTSGSGNTGLGSMALSQNTAGTFNTAVGYASLRLNTSSGRNTAVGVGALVSQAYDNGGTPWDADNTAIGYETLSKNVPSSAGNGIQNTGLGSWAMRENTTGSYNVALGYYALKDNTTGGGNVAIGHSAGTGYNGDNQLFIGNGLGTLIRGNFDTKRVGINTIAGQTLSVGGTLGIQGGSGFTVLQGSGAQAGDVTYTLPVSSTNGVLRNSSGTLSWDASTSPGGSGTAGGLAYWTAPSTLASATGLAWDAGNGRLGIGTGTPGQQLELTGNLALPTTTATGGQVIVGVNRFLHSYGAYNTFLGAPSGNFTLTGAYNTAAGALTLVNNTSGQDGTAAGTFALYANTSGSANTGLGSSALQNNTSAGRNTAVGFGALVAQDYGNGGLPWNADNTAVGWQALNRNRPTSINDGIRNTALGSEALYGNTTGLENTAAGFQSSHSNSTGFQNTAIGVYSLASNTEGNYNVALGWYALGSNTTGGGNVAIGHNAGTGVNVDNQLFIGNGLGTLIWGDFNAKRVAIGMTGGVYQLQLNVDSAGKPGGGSWANSSDARLKRDIRPIEGALERLLALRGVSFAWIHPEEHGGLPVEQGFIAQDVERVFPEWVRMIEPTGADRELVAPGEQVRSLSLPFAFDATLVEALREQQERIDRQKAAIDALTCEVEALKSALAERNRNLERRLAELEDRLRVAAGSRSH